MLLPVLLWGHLRDEDPVSTACQSCHQGQISARKQSHWSSFEQFFFNHSSTVGCTHPQCLPITSRIKVLWWLRKGTSHVKDTWNEKNLGPICHVTSGRAPLCCGGDGIHDLNDAMKGRVCANGHVGAAEVIINGANHANDVEMGGILGLSGCDLT